MAKTDNMLKIKLRDNSKNPTAEWRKNKVNCNSNRPKLYPSDYVGNLGIVCGKLNNLVVVDTDFYDSEKSVEKHGKFDPENNEFIKAFGMDYIDHFDTYTIETPNGGYHMYFENEPEIYMCSSKHRVDTRGNDNSYILAPGCIIDGHDYNVLYEGATIKKMPIELKEWLLKNVCKRNQSQKPKQLKEADVWTEEEKQAYNNDQKMYEWYKFDKETVEKLMTQLDKKYWEDFDLWIKFTTACKCLGYKDT